MTSAGWWEGKVRGKGWKSSNLLKVGRSQELCEFSGQEHWVGGGQFRIFSWSWLSKAAPRSWWTQGDWPSMTYSSPRRWVVRMARMNSPWHGLQVRQQRLRPCTMLSTPSLPMELSTSISPHIVPSAPSHDGHQPCPPTPTPHQGLQLYRTTPSPPEEWQNCSGAWVQVFYCVHPS